MLQVVRGLVGAAGSAILRPICKGLSRGSSGTAPAAVEQTAETSTTEDTVEASQAPPIEVPARSLLAELIDDFEGPPQSVDEVVVAQFQDWDIHRGRSAHRQSRRRVNIVPHTISDEIIRRIIDAEPESGTVPTVCDILGKGDNPIANNFGGQLIYWDYARDPEIENTGALVLLSAGELVHQGRTLDEVLYEMSIYAIPGDCIHVITPGKIRNEITSIIETRDDEIFTEDQFLILEDALHNPDEESLGAIDNALALRILVRTIFASSDTVPYDFDGDTIYSIR